MPTTAPARTAAPRWVAPVLVGSSVLAATALVAAVDPEQPGHYPACPFHALTGWWCPGCGGLRAVHALAHGEIGTAVDRNALLVLAVPVLLMAWAGWLRRTVTGTVQRTVPVAALWGLVVTVGAFWLLRNVPVGSWLAPT